MPHDPKISTTNKTALLLIISLMLISCGDSISKNSKTWHIEDTEAQDHHIDNKEGTTKTDCVQQGSITIKWKDDLEKLKSFQCNTLDGSVYIELKEVAHTSLDRGENVSEINDIGNLKKVKGAIVFGELGPDERYLDSENTFSNQNPFLNKIHGFASLEMVETIILTDARGLRSLEAFEGLNYLGNIYITQDHHAASRVGIRCAEVDRLIEILGEAYKGEAHHCWFEQDY